MHAEHQTVTDDEVEGGMAVVAVAVVLMVLVGLVTTVYLLAVWL